MKKMVFIIKKNRVSTLPGQTSALECMLGAVDRTHTGFRSSAVQLPLCIGVHARTQVHSSVRLLSSSSSVPCSILAQKMLFFNFFASSRFKPQFSFSNLQDTKTPKIIKKLENIKVKGVVNIN
jgi:hypothetical protein